MSLKKWRQQAEAETEVEKQEQEIRRAYKTNRIAKEVGQIEAEKLFQPVTRRMDHDLPAPAAEEVGPDYVMDEFDRNPFDWGDFRPEAETLPPTPEEQQEEEDNFFPPPPHHHQLMGMIMKLLFNHHPRRAKRGRSLLKGTSESVQLQTINQLLTKFGNDLNYRVKSKTSPFHGFSVADLRKVQEEIYDRRRGGRREGVSLQQQLQVGRKGLKQTPPKETRPRSPTDWEQAVLSRRPAIELVEDWKRTMKILNYFLNGRTGQQRGVGLERPPTK